MKTDESRPTELTERPDGVRENDASFSRASETLRVSRSPDVTE